MIDGERGWLLAAVCLYGGVFAASLRTLRHHSLRPPPEAFLGFLSAFVCHTVFLFLRAAEIHHCPMTNLFEVAAFIGWSVALIYLVVGPIYRMTLLGFLTAPMLAAGLAVSMLLPIDSPNPHQFPSGPAFELHVALSLLAYGCMAVSATAGLFYLMQDHCLKRKYQIAWLATIPSLHDLAQVNRHLMAVSILFLTGGLVASLPIAEQSEWPKLLWLVIFWFYLSAVTAAAWARRISSHRTAAHCVIIFVAMISTFWLINSFAPSHSSL